MNGTQLNLQTIERELRSRIKGEVSISEITRYCYSTDASVYRVMPSCVVFPKDKDDVKATIIFANENGIPIHARGAGSGLGGAALGTGIVIAFRKYMNKIIEINEEKSYTIVQPGVICGALNKKLGEIGKILYVDNSSEHYASIGGMIGTNSSGAHAVKYGYMADFVEELTVILSNGEEIQTRPIEIDSDEYKEILAADTLESTIYKTCVELVNNPETQKLISENFPKVKMSVSGYNLRDLIDGNKIDISKLFLGSEATLGIVVESKLNMIPKPKKMTLIVMDFDSLGNSGRAVDLIVKNFGPSAIEVLGKSVLEIGVKQNPSLKSIIPEGVDNVLYIEFDEDDDSVRTEKVEKTRQLIIEQEKLATDMRFSDDPAEQATLWKVRKEAVPLLQTVRAPRRIMAFVEDQTVPLEHLGHYMTTLRNDVFPKYGIEAAIYGHAAKGLVHTRPFVDTKSAEDIKIIEKIADEVNNLVIDLGGSVAGEHNDGMMRVKFVKQLYGEELYGIFKQIKGICDPSGILNPDKKITEKENLLTSNLRYGPEYSTIPIKTNLVWHEERGFEDEIEYCHGCGKCTVQFLPARDCPVYRGKMDTAGELASPRARSNLMRGIISSQLDFNLLFTKEARQILEDCAGCMMCLIDCPSVINVPKFCFDAKVIHYKKSRWPYIGRIPRGNWFSGNFEFLARISSFFAPFSNLAMWGPNKYLTQVFGGVHHKAQFPKFERKTFRKWFKKYRKTNPPPSNPAKKVAIFHGCFANYTENTDIAIAQVQVFEKNNIEVVVPDKQYCCGIPLLSNGLGEIAVEKGKKNTATFIEYVKQGYDVVTQCSSCYATLKDELYETLVGTDEAKQIRDNLYFFSEYIINLMEEGNLNTEFKNKNGVQLGYHEPCHLISSGKKGITAQMLDKVSSVDMKALATECCGMLGSWGFKSKNYKYSQKIAELSLYPQAARNDVNVLVTDCPTCKLQLLNQKKEILHPTQVLRDAYGLKSIK